MSFGKRSHSRYFPNTLEPEALDELHRDTIVKTLAHCARIVIAATQTFSSASVYTGQGGTVLMMYRIERFLKSGAADALTLQQLMGVRLHEIRENACQLIKGIAHSSHFHRRLATFVEGLAGALALRMILCEGDRDAIAQQLLSICQKTSEMSSSECEILYGRAGCLSAIHVVRKELKWPEYGTQEVQLLLRQILTEGLQQASSPENVFRAPLLFFWHGEAYIGAAHGVIGILQMFINFRTEWKHIEPDFSKVLGSRGIWGIMLDTINHIMAYHATSEGFVSSSFARERIDKDILVHWCHGSPGMALLIASMIESGLGTPAEQKQLNDMAHKQGNAIWERGLLKKGLGLCHGIGGNGLALLRLSDATGDIQWRNKANQFALFGATHLADLKDIPDRPASLFEGIAGFVWFLCDILQDGCKASFPGMD